MNEPRFVDRGTLGGTRKTSDGYLVAEVRCARTGCQTYSAAELGLGDGMLTVYRPPEAVFDRRSMATFAGKPVTLGHPPENVTADNWREYAVGDIGEEIARDGEFVRVPIKLMDARAIRAVEAGTQEISMGYTTPIAMQDGVAPDGTKYQAVQTGPIRINHLAVVLRARGGSNLRIGDDAAGGGETREQWGAAPIHDAGTKEATMPDLRKVVVDGLSVETTDAGAEAITKLQGQLADKAREMTDAANAHDAAIEAKDEEIGALKAKLADAEGKVPTQEALDKMVADRAALVAAVAKVAPNVKPAGLTDAALRRAAVVAKHGEEVVADVSDAEIRGMFAIIAREAKSDPAAKALGDAKPVATNDRATDAYNAMLADMAGAWKNQKGAA